MAYEKTNWINNVTPLNATNMNHIETGIEANSTNIGDLSNLSTTAKNNTVAAINELDSDKVEKVSTASEVAAYIHNGSTQGVKVITNTPTSSAIPMYDSNTRIKTNTTATIFSSTNA